MLGPGQVVQHRYVLVRPLGQGAMGTSYLAQDLVRDEAVTLKLLRKGSPALLGALKAEFYRLRGLFHPNLCRVNDFGALRAADGTQLAFYTADYVEGTTLGAFAPGRRFRDVLAPLAHALEALDFLHRTGVRHGDFKPENILVDARSTHPRGVLIDLGCSQPLDDDTSSNVSGTPGFLAPELLAGQRVDARADLYAVGVTLKQLLAVTTSAPSAARRLAERLCVASPAARPGDVQEVLDALDVTARGTPAPSAEPPRLLGRHAELDQFTRSLAQARERADGPRVLLLLGPEGIGRTRLLQEMKWEAQLRGDVVEGDARQSGAVASMLRRATGRPDLPTGLQGLFAAREILRERASPVVLMLDDADALEGPERELWLALLRSVEPSDPCLVVASESGPSPLEAASTSAIVLTLPPLELDEVTAWTAGTLSPGRGPLLMRLTGGFPAAIRSLLTLVSCGYVSDDELSALTARSAISERRRKSLEELDPEAMRALGLIAAQGGALDLRDAAEAQLSANALGRLVERGWARPEAIGFRLARAGDATWILKALGPKRRAELHAIAAERVRARARGLEGAQASAYAARWVRHLCLAGRAAEAEAAIAEHTALAEAHPDVWGEAARALAEHATGPAGALYAARIHEAAGRPAEALSLLARILRARPSEAVRHAARLRAAAAYVRQGDLRRARLLLDRVLAATPDAGARARALDLTSRVHIRHGLWADAAASARQGLALDPPPDIAADLHDDLGVAASYLGDLEAARDHLGHAARLHAEGARPRAEARSASYRALADYRGGDAVAAARGFRRALAIAEAAGATDLLANAALNVGTASHQIGDLGEALRSYEQGLRIAIALGQASTEATLRYNLAKLFADVGAEGRAAEAARRAEARAEARGLSLLAGAARAVRGEAALLRGAAAEAAAELTSARDRFARAAAAREVAEAGIQLAEAKLALGELVEGEQALADAAHAADRLTAGDLVGRARLMLGRYALVRGRWAEGVDHLEEAERLARSAGQRLLEAEVEARLADAFRTNGAEVRARRHAQAACELWERAAATLPPHLAEAFWAHPLRTGRREALLEPTQGARAPKELKLRRLLEINKKLSASLEARQILSWAIDSALELTGAERGFVLLARTGSGDGETEATPSARALEVAVAHNLDASTAGQTGLEFSQSIAERVIESGEPLVTVDAQGDQRFAGNASVHAMRLKSVACAPIRAPSGVLGALYVDHRFQRGLFGTEDMELLMGFADQVAIALTNARLHDQLARKTRELLAERHRIEALLEGQVARIDRLTEEVREKQEALERRYEYGNIVGRSAAMQAVFRTLDRVSDAPATVLIEGESGTGKELIARAIHWNSARRGGPFVTINCGALPEPLLESELVGFVRGAFTGAHRDREGLLVSARGGTLFLDELGEMPIGMQVKLLRVLQEREVQPLGASTTSAIDVRFVCATNRRLRDEVAVGRFREDLYYRVGVVEIRVPPLRERLEDIPELAARFVREAARSAGRPAPQLSPGALRALLAHRWPGNVRELENVCTKAVLLSEGAPLGAADIELPGARVSAALPTGRAAFEQEDQAHVLSVLRACRWNVSAACKALGVPRATLYRKLKRYGAERPARGRAAGGTKSGGRGRR